MEQNLSERERKIRLGLGLVFAAGAGYSFAANLGTGYVLGLSIAAAGFMANYFTCFCGTKKAINSLKQRIS